MEPIGREGLGLAGGEIDDGQGLVRAADEVIGRGRVILVSTKKRARFMAVTSEVTVNSSPRRAGMR
jgi:hypothetical protein